MAGGIPDLIFLHHKKTGGLTLRYLLREHYGDALYEPMRGERVDSPYLRYLREETDSFDVEQETNDPSLERWWQLSGAERERMRVLAGHFWYGVHERVGRPESYVTILRHPIDRVLSMHAHYREHCNMTVPFDRYVLTERDWDLSNGQTRRLATAWLGEHIGDVTQTMYDVAAERLTDKFLVVGTTERFDEMAIALAHALGWRSTAYRLRSASGSRLTRSQVPTALLDRLTARNEFDVRLHALANELLDKKLAGIDVATALQQHERATRVNEYKRQARVKLADAMQYGKRATEAARRRLAR